MSQQPAAYAIRRRVPRRAFGASVGVLHGGVYRIEKSMEVGEGGMSLSATRQLKENDRLILTFQIPDGSLVCVRASVRYFIANEEVAGTTTGVQFENLDFNLKRELRNYVARATQESIFI